MTIEEYLYVKTDEELTDLLFIENEYGKKSPEAALQRVRCEFIREIADDLLSGNYKVI